jgi:hypothetical protein
MMQYKISFDKQYQLIKTYTSFIYMMFIEVSSLTLFKGHVSWNSILFIFNFVYGIIHKAKSE